MSAPAATVVLASAGTGKTYQLALRMVALLARGTPPDAILASTFTRKAAGEILDRVLGRLAEAASDEARAAALSRDLGADHGRAFWTELLARLARRVDRFGVTTLDAFFVRLARAFQPELGLPAEWRVADELADRRLRHEALARLVAEEPPRAFVELLRDLQRADASRSVLDAALRAISIGAAACEESEADAWSWIEPPPAPGEGELEAALLALEAFECPRTKAGSPNKNWQKSLDSLRAALALEDWGGLLKLTLVEAVLEGRPRYSSVELADDFHAALQVVLARAAHELGRELDRQNRATRALIAGFEERYAAVRAAARALRFEHLPGVLVGGALGGLGGLAARLGTRLEHLLLDEFQDTSPPQWRVLAPLAHELARDASGERSVFCVGDPKQSIYGWRQAEPRLLENLAAELSAERRELRKSWRSSPVVIDAVNRVFTQLAASRVFSGEPWMAEVALRFQERFPPHEAEHARRPGDVSIRTSPAPDGDGDLACLRLAARRAAELHEAAPAARIAILLRRNKGIPRLLFELKRLGVLASGEGGNPLDDAACVQVVLSLLLLADHPGDRAAFFHAAASPLAGALELDFERPETALACARGLRRDLAERGYEAVLRGLRPAVERAWGSAWERRRFAQLLELAAVWGPEAGLRPSRFVERVRHEKVEDPSAARVRVMTVHRAKGLEFDAVLLPELDRSWARTQTELYLRRRDDDPSALYERVSRSTSKAVRGLLPEVQALYEDTRRLQLTEELCGLYVAMTRAVHHLELIVAPRAAAKDDEGLPVTPAALVRELLDASSAEPDQVIWRHEASSEAWLADKGRDEERAQRGGARRESPIPLRPRRRARELPREAASRRAEPETVATAELFAPREAVRGRGSLVHAWLERVEWLEDFAVGDEALLADARALGLPESLAREELPRLRALLASGPFADLLQRAAAAARLGAAPADLEVLRERRFAQLVGPADAPDALLHGAFDRAVVARAAGRAELVDFKTDAIAEDEVAARAEHHRPQLEAYRAALARISGLPEQAIACRVAFVALGRVVDL